MEGAALQAKDIFIDPSLNESFVGRKQVVQISAKATDYYPVKEFTGKTPDGQNALLEWTEQIVYSAPTTFSYDTSASERVSELHRYVKTLWLEIRKSPQTLIPLPVVAYYRATRRMDGMPELGDIFKLDLARDKAFVSALDAAANFTVMCQWFYLRENA